MHLQNSMRNLGAILGTLLNIGTLTASLMLLPSADAPETPLPDATSK
jgi:hypothetical protein